MIERNICISFTFRFICFSYFWLMKLYNICLNIEFIISVMQHNLFYLLKYIFDVRVLNLYMHHWFFFQPYMDAYTIPRLSPFECLPRYNRAQHFALMLGFERINQVSCYSSFIHNDMAMFLYVSLCFIDRAALYVMNQLSLLRSTQTA